MTKEQIITTLEKEIENELACLRITQELRKKTWNPFKKISFKNSEREFRYSVITLNRIMIKIKNKEES